MKALTFLLKPVSSACNMGCDYCFYADVSARRALPCVSAMTERFLARMLERIREALDPGDAVCFVFQGGEPTLAGLDFYRRFFEITGEWERRLRISYAFQTNGLLLDEEWCALLKRRNLLTGLSLDLPRTAHDAIRTDPAGAGTYGRVLHAMNLLKRRGLAFNVLSTLTAQAAAQPQAVWRAVRALEIPYIQFTPCLGPLDAPEYARHRLSPEGFAAFYKAVFPLWLTDVRSGGGCGVKLFDDLVQLMAVGWTSACGLDGRCRSQLVVEADGSVYPCDFYCTDDFRSGNILTDPLNALLRAPSVSERMQAALPAPCGSCAFRRLCGGGCPRMREAMYLCGDGYCGYADFLDEALPTLTGIAAALCRRLRPR